MHPSELATLSATTLRSTQDLTRLTTRLAQLEQYESMYDTSQHELHDATSQITTLRAVVTRLETRLEKLHATRDAMRDVEKRRVERDAATEREVTELKQQFMSEMTSMMRKEQERGKQVEELTQKLEEEQKQKQILVRDGVCIRMLCRDASRVMCVLMYAHPHLCCSTIVTLISTQIGHSVTHNNSMHWIISNIHCPNVNKHGVPHKSGSMS